MRERWVPLLLDLALCIRPNLARARRRRASSALSRAVLGERLRVQVQVRIAPEVLPVATSFLALQPLVETPYSTASSSRRAVGRCRSAPRHRVDSVIAVEDGRASHRSAPKTCRPGIPPERTQDVPAGRGTGTSPGPAAKALVH
ncbi:MAG: hypothetical protein JNM77_01445 [Pseudonocardia sp.]|nr:hypothetical protein [Pseudonocardia sp.]